MSATAALLTATTSPAVKGTPFDSVDNTQSLIFVWFTVTLLGNYPAGGDILDLSGTAFGDAVKALGPPLDVDLKSFASGGVSGFCYDYRPGTSSALGKIQMFTGAAAQSALTEFTAGAYPAGALADSILGRAIFIRL